MDFFEAYNLSRIRFANEDAVRLMRKQNREYDELLRDYNHVVKIFNIDTAILYAQREEALKIISENIDNLPADYDTIIERVKAAGADAEKRIIEKHGY